MFMIKDEIEKLKKIQQAILDYLDNYENDIVDSKKIINFLDDECISKNTYLFRDFLCLISYISNYHQKTQFFWEKIDLILSHYKKEIKENFLQSTIFNIFHNNKRILYFLFNNNILTMDKNIKDHLKDHMNKLKYNGRNVLYFIKEMNPFLEDSSFKFWIEKYPEICDYQSESFDQKRKIGENEDYICELIRNDLIDEFIIYVNQSNILMKKYYIISSIFETNYFLTLFNGYSLFEYAAFFGSIKIFKYLLMNGVELTSSIWLFAIHGRNPEIIHLLEENQIKPVDTTYKSCLEEAIKCHHNELINYIKENLYNTESEKNVYLKSLKCFNFIYLSENEPNDLDYSQLLCHFCINGCCSIINNLIDDLKFNVNIQIIVEKEKIEIVGCMKMNKYQKVTASPILFAVQKKNIELVTILLKRIDLNINMKGHYITKNNDCKFDRLSEEIDEEKTALSIAISKDDIKIIELLIQRNDININLKLNKQESKKFEESGSCIGAKVYKIREEKQMQRTAFHDAICHQKYDIIKLLLEIKNIDFDSKYIVHDHQWEDGNDEKPFYKGSETKTAIELASYYNKQIIDLLNSYNKALHNK